MAAPALQPRLVDRLMAVAGIPDIVVAGDRAKPHPQAAQELGCMAQVFFDIGAVDGDVAGMDDEVRALLADPTGERRPVVGEMRLPGAQMRVRDLNYPHHSSRRRARILQRAADRRDHQGNARRRRSR